MGSTLWRLMRLKKPESFCSHVRLYPKHFPISTAVDCFTYRSEFCQHSSICQAEELVAEDGPNQPSHGHHANRAQSHQHEGVQATKLRRQRGVIAVRHHGCKAIIRDSNGAYYRAALSDPSACSSKCEEVVPCEFRLRC